jgi:hypothetical protein
MVSLIQQKFLPPHITIVYCMFICDTIPHRAYFDTGLTQTAAIAYSFEIATRYAKQYQGLVI